jgi:hypothetical protein
MHQPRHVPLAAVVRAQLSLEVELAGSGDAVRVLPAGEQVANDLDTIKMFNEYCPNGGKLGYGNGLG